MANSIIQRSIGTTATQIWGGGAGNGSVVVINLDSSNTVFIGNGSNIIPAAPYFPLGPGNSITLDGTQPIYAVSNEQVNVGVLPGGSSFFQPATLSGLGGVKVYVQGTAPTGTIPVNSVWINSSNGNQLNNWDGSSWSPVVFNATDTIQAGTIISSLIEAGTITATQLAAGIIYAGIIDGTTVSAATFIGSTFEGNDFILNQDGLFFYTT
jgi:hypothetical protein